MPGWSGAFEGAGLYGGIDEAVYHRDPVPEGSLSSSGAKLIVEQGGPAKFAYQREHGGKSSKSMDLGTVVHALVLGTGAEIEVLDHDNYTTKAAKADRDAAIDAGKVPMLARAYAEAEAIARRVLEHDVAGGLFAPGEFDAEVSMFWLDEEFRIWCRGRLDCLTNPGRVIIGDLKTAADASPDGFTKAVERFRYYVQEWHYRQGLAVLLGCDVEDIDFLFAVVETEPPYLVAVYDLADLDGRWRESGRELTRIAREKYRDCTTSGIWPGYDADVKSLEMPRYTRLRIEKEINDYFD